MLPIHYDNETHSQASSLLIIISYSIIYTKQTYTNTEGQFMYEGELNP